MNIWLILLILISILFFFFLFYPLVKGFNAKGNPVPLLSDIVSKSTRKHSTYLLYIWSPTCGVCRSMSTVVDKLMEHRDDIDKIDASRHPEVIRELGVLGTPAIVIIEKGLIKKVSLGAKTGNSILSMLDD